MTLHMFFAMEPPELPRAIFAHETVYHSSTARMFRDKVCAVVDDVVDDEPENAMVGGYRGNGGGGDEGELGVWGLQRL